MDDTRFDTLAMWLSAVRSRRAALRVTGAAGLMVLLGSLGVGPVAAKHRRHHKPTCRKATQPCGHGKGTCCGALVCRKNRTCPLLPSGTLCCAESGAACKHPCDCCTGLTCSAGGTCIPI
jgi:hypothetical protein